MEEACSNHTGAGTDIPEQISHRHRMNDVGVPTGSELALVQLKRKIEGRCEQSL